MGTPGTWEYVTRGPGTAGLISRTPRNAHHLDARSALLVIASWQHPWFRRVRWALCCCCLANAHSPFTATTPPARCAGRSRRDATGSSGGQGRGGRDATGSKGRGGARRAPRVLSRHITMTPRNTDSPYARGGGGGGARSLDCARARPIAIARDGAMSPPLARVRALAVVRRAPRVMPRRHVTPTPPTHAAAAAAAAALARLHARTCNRSRALWRYATVARTRTAPIMNVGEMLKRKKKNH